MTETRERFEKYAWPGGYPVYCVMDDGEALCIDCANDPSNPVHKDEPNDGWRIVGQDIN